MLSHGGAGSSLGHGNGGGLGHGNGGGLGHGNGGGLGHGLPNYITLLITSGNLNISKLSSSELADAKENCHQLFDEFIMRLKDLER